MCVTTTALVAAHAEHAPPPCSSSARSGVAAENAELEARGHRPAQLPALVDEALLEVCLLYTSDAADE